MESKLKEQFEAILKVSPVCVRPEHFPALLDALHAAYKLDREEPEKDGWIDCELPMLPYTGNYQVRDVDGNEFECIYIDFGEDRGWQCENLIVSYKNQPLP